METNIIQILNGLEFLYPENTTVAQLKRALQTYPECERFLIDAVSVGQLKSKRWLVSELEKTNVELGTVFLCAGWYATLAAMLFDSNCTIERIRSFDIDSTCEKIAETINKAKVKDNWQFKAATLDIKKLEYDNFTYSTHRRDGSELQLTDTADTVINTSCEHIYDFNDWYANIPRGVLVVLQSNNYIDIEEHVNCSTSLANFADTTPMTEVLYSGQLSLDKYDRYMRIGIK